MASAEANLCSHELARNQRSFRVDNLTSNERPLGKDAFAFVALQNAYFDVACGGFSEGVHRR